MFCCRSNRQDVGELQESVPPEFGQARSELREQPVPTRRPRGRPRKVVDTAQVEPIPARGQPGERGMSTPNSPPPKPPTNVAPSGSPEMSSHPRKAGGSSRPCPTYRGRTPGMETSQDRAARPLAGPAGQRAERWVRERPPEEPSAEVTGPRHPENRTGEVHGGPMAQPGVDPTVTLVAKSFSA